MEKTKGVAIVGMDCRYPGANSLQEYWENILSLRQQFRRIPDKRLNLDYYSSDDRSNPDYTYSKKAAVLSDYEFDRIKYRVSKSTFEQTDMAHWIALDVAAGALKSAGFENGIGLNKKRVGCILGNSLTGEFTRANVMRLRWPYVLKVLESTLSNMDYSNDDILKILTNAEKVYKAPFPEPDADTLAGGLSNTIAGRICNYFDFNGGGFTIDGACSSSLLAVANGCNSIMSNELDVALVGGVDLSIDPFEVIGFARNGALASQEMEVFNDKSQGFWPGEGCGIVVLMSEEEAIKKGLNIYSVIRGWGISSDGAGGITRPKPETQSMAFDRAYEKAGYGIDSVALFEGHGTGTVLGDKVEMTALINSLRNSNKTNQAAVLGSVKHLIGHTKAAAGVAGLIKASLSVKNNMLPASRSTKSQHSLLKENKELIKLSQETELYKSKQPMRASVSSMGFGGINVHLTIEEGTNAKRVKRISGSNQKLAHSLRDVEVFPVTAQTKDALLAKIDRLKLVCRDISRSEFIDLSATLCKDFEKGGKFKSSLVAANPDQLLENLSLMENEVQNDSVKYINKEKGIFFQQSGQQGKLAFLFPGQGAPIYNSLGAFNTLAREVMNGTYKSNDFKPAADGVTDTSIAQPAIVRGSLQSVEFLEQLGIEADVAIGHSLGEISALSWAGVMDEDTAVEVAVARGKAMSELGAKGGAMLALKCSEEELTELIKDLKVTITGFNGTGNYVVGGENAAILEVQQRAFQQEYKHFKLNVSHAFHTPMMKEAADFFKEKLQDWDFETIEKTVISTVDNKEIEDDLDVVDHLYQQIESPVQFTQAIEQIKDTVDLFIEVGPGKSLTSSLRGYEEMNVLPLDYGSDSLKELYHILSAAYVFGNEVQFEELFHNRFYRSFDIENWALNVLVNPCEKIDHKSSNIQHIIADNNNSSAAANGVDHSATGQTEAAGEQLLDNSLEGIEDYFKNLISKKTEIPVDVITNKDKIMSELHLNSLAITEIIALLTKNYKKSHEVFSKASIVANADGSIHEVCKVIFEGETAKGGTSNTNLFEHSTNWTHVFQRTNVVKKAPRIKNNSGKGEIIIEDKAGLIISDLQAKIATANLTSGSGAIYVYDAANGKAALDEFVVFLNKESVRACEFVALVNVYDASKSVSGSLLPIFRTFTQEAAFTSATIGVDLDASLANKADLLIDELKVLSKYKEVRYDAESIRTESQVEVFFPKNDVLTKTIEDGDVILATGGGKGITFASIFSLAKRTGAKLAIFGRSLPEKSEELSANLDLLKEKNIDFRYYSVNVCDAAQIDAKIKQTVEDLGPIKVLIHGAGVNNPKPLNFLKPEDFQRTTSIKVGGLENVIAAIDPSALKVMIGYGSIIAQSGMQGNADYAWANDQLALCIDDYGKKNPTCKCLTMEWSVWDETGMGVNLKSIDSLKEKGVYPIPVKNGVNILKALIADETCKNGRFVISGRYGKIPTLNYTKPKFPFGRYITKPKSLVPGVEVVSEVSINLTDDIYLKNHVFQNQYVFPTVMILEAMTQVTSMLQQELGAVTIEDLKIHKSIFIPEKGNNTIRIIVSRTSAASFEAVVQSEDSNFEVNCFEAKVVLDHKTSFQIEAEEFTQLQPLDLNVENKFYDDLLFHHGPFRRIKSFSQITALESIAQADSNLEDKWFGAHFPNKQILGDPGLNDAAIHCHQACRPGYNLLPVAAKQIIFNPKEISGPFFIKTVETAENGNDTHIDVCVFNSAGEVKQYWKDMILTKVSGTSFKGHWDAHFLTAHIQYKLMKLMEQREVNFPLERCMNMMKSLKSAEYSNECRAIKGFLISLNFGKLESEQPFRKGEWIDSYSDQNPYAELEIDILNTDKTAILKIARIEN